VPFRRARFRFPARQHHRDAARDRPGATCLTLFMGAGYRSGSLSLVGRATELKNYIGLRRLKLRRMRFVREQFYLAATAQNLKRLMRFLSGKPTPQIATA